MNGKVNSKFSKLLAEWKCDRATREKRHWTTCQDGVTQTDTVIPDSPLLNIIFIHRCCTRCRILLTECQTVIDCGKFLLTRRCRCTAPKQRQMQIYEQLFLLFLSSFFLKYITTTVVHSRPTVMWPDDYVSVLAAYMTINFNIFKQCKIQNIFTVLNEDRDFFRLSKSSKSVGPKLNSIQSRDKETFDSLDFDSIDNEIRISLSFLL